MSKGIIGLHCKKCEHEWQETIELPMRAEAYIARLRGWATCPGCGQHQGRHITMGEFIPEDKEKQ